MRGKGAVLCLLAAGLLAAACRDPREAELVQELAGLQEGRVAKTSFDRMMADADRQERAVAQAEAELEDLRTEIAHARSEAGAAEARMQREVERNARLNEEIRAGQQRLQEEAARQASLEQEIAIARARAQTFKDQAAVLARELRPEDPEWARRLRVRTLREFLGEVQAAWPGDPVLAGAAREPLPADDREAARVGAELAARIRDRVSEVYGLGSDSSEARTPAAAAGPDAS
jgi:hypothetical protein